MKYYSVYLVVKDFEQAVSFYERILEMKVSAMNGARFAMFQTEGLCLCIMNGRFDSAHRGEIETKGEPYAVYDDLDAIADSENSRKVFLNFGVEDLRAEYQRIQSLHIARELTPIRYIKYASPYWYFTFMDPDGNPIEITGGYEE